MRVSNLQGELLAQWVARANGWPVEVEDGDDVDSPLYTRDEHGIPQSFTVHGYWPHGNWVQGGPLIAAWIDTLDRADDHGTYPVTADEPWYASAGRASAIGPTPLIAAMRAYVASKFGDTVSDS